jgi:hypothetical protein
VYKTSNIGVRSDLTYEPCSGSAANGNRRVPAKQKNSLQQVGRMIQILRGEKRLSIENIAGETGLNPDEINGLESGQMSFESFVQCLPGLAKALGVDQYLLFSAFLDFALQD